MYHGFQYVQVSGLPADYVPDENTLVGLQTNADVPTGGTVTTSSDLINQIHRMSEYSIRSNMQSIFTDCPHREKLGWLADMIQSMGAIHSNFDVSGFLRNMQQEMLESQQPGGLVPGTAPEFPNFGGGYRDDVNWGGALIITPYFLWQTYGDTRTMRQYYGLMQDHLAYVRAQIGSNGLLVSGIGDWITADTTTPKDVTGTYGLYVTSTSAHVISTAGDAAQRRRPRPPGQRRVHAARPAACRVLEGDLDGAGRQRSGDRHLPPAPRRDRRAADGQLHEDAHLHVVGD